jgi:cytosine deaminase
MIDLLLSNGRISGAKALLNLAVDGGRILDCQPGLSYPALQEIDLGGRLVVPGFVESHVHLDIALMNSWQVPGRQEPYRSVAGFNEAVERRRKSFTRQDIEARASAALELASRHGVTAMRAQCHVDTEVGLKHLEALLAMKEKVAGRIDLQIVAFPQQGLLRNQGTLDLFREAFRAGADVMGCASNLEQDPAHRSFIKHIDTAMDLAMEMDVDLDAHVDLGLPEQVELDDLETVYLARRALECGYRGRVTAGHVCALDSARPDVVERAVELMLEAQISVISQPDMYRLGRDDVSHVRRGLTRVKQLLAAGVNVCFASNNVRDGYRPMGNFNLLEEALILAYGAHMDTIDDLSLLLSMCTTHAARALHLEGYGTAPGCSADLVVLDAFSPSAAVVGQAEKRYVFKAGRLTAANRVVQELY